MTMMTPYLPDDAKGAVKDHFTSKKMPAFLKAVELGEGFMGYCPNCAGLGVIIIQFADKGPYREPITTNKPVTWFDGDGTAGKGWYVIGRTVEYTCSHCKGEKHDPKYKPEKQVIDSDRKFHRPEKIGALLR